MDNLLKGNYKMKNSVKGSEPEAESVREEYKKQAMSSIGGSMVFVERDELFWDGNDEEGAAKEGKK